MSDYNYDSANNYNYDNSSSDMPGYGYDAFSPGANSYQGDMGSETYQGASYVGPTGMDGLKSGTTLVSGHCYLGTAQRDGHRVISIVMNALTKEELNAATKALLEYGLSQKL